MPLTTSPESPVPVRQVVSLIGGWVDRLGAVWVEGQVIGFNRPASSGTDFIRLRDKLGRGLGRPHRTAGGGRLAAQPAGQRRPASWCTPGRRSTPAAARCRCRCARSGWSGEGELLARLERRRQLLAAEGLFALELKRPLPFLPRRVGLVTAKASAAEKDVLENARRRWPGVDFVVEYAAMQGPSCAAQVIDALQQARRRCRPSR